MVAGDQPMLLEKGFLKSSYSRRLIHMVDPGDSYRPQATRDRQPKNAQCLPMGAGGAKVAQI
jgi:hypothetical protein